MSARRAATRGAMVERAATRGAMVERVLREQLRAHIPDVRRARLCVAYSGGRDSSLLLAALVALRASMGLQLRAVHINHQLQADAGAWARAARARAAELAVPFRALKVQVLGGGTSVESSAREARYRALREQLAAGEWLLTAHHQDDQLETVLLQLLRGAGLAGLAAMPVIAPFGPGWLLRPLLALPGSVLAEQARHLGLGWVEDPSNRDERFDRSFLRIAVLPLLQQRWPAAGATVARSAAHLAEAQRLLEQQADAQLALAQSGRALSGVVLRRFADAQQRNVLRRWLKRSGLPAPDTARLAQLQNSLLPARHDATPLLAWPGAEVRRHGDLLFAQPPLPPLPQAQGWRWRRQRRVLLAGAGQLQLLDDAHGDLALGRLPAQLEIRFRSGGERLVTATGHKPLKNLLQEIDLAPWLRNRLPLLYHGERLLAVADVWRDPALAPGRREPHRARLQFASAFV